jgi:phenylacetic acid degradation operon negative regulatory protein
MNDVVILQAEAREFLSRVALKALVQEKWGIAELEGRYKRFLVIFRPVLDAIIKKIKLDPEDCFLLRVLLIHEYRRILLRDHDLPLELLPSGWPGLNARNLTVNLYARLSPRAEEFITTELESAEGPLPKASNSFHERFNRS